MLFSSFTFVYLFLPLVLVGYFALNRRGWEEAGRGWLVVASLFFYGYWNPLYLPLLVGSLVANYGFGLALQWESGKRSLRARLLVGIGVAFNLGLLGFFKYTDFLIGNFNQLFGATSPLLELALPVAISFFTFQQKLRTSSIAIAG